MSAVEERWRERQVRFEDGIAWVDDEFAELCGAPGEGFRADLRLPVARLIQFAPDGWTNVEERCVAEGGDFTVYAGETSAEGAGFVAVEQKSTGRLLWVLHLSNAEPFVEVACDGQTVRAVSEEYPNRWVWRIPVDAPEELTAVAAR